MSSSGTPAPILRSPRRRHLRVLGVFRSTMPQFWASKRRPCTVGPAPPEVCRTVHTGISAIIPGLGPPRRLVAELPGGLILCVEEYPDGTQALSGWSPEEK